MTTTNTPETQAIPVRERILRTAHDLFYREGIRATGIDKIIAASSVSKVTFYRYFPSKNQLIMDYLEYRHTQWMAWFGAALDHYGAECRNAPDILLAVFYSWFSSADFRGCAFINSVVEMDGALPEAAGIARRHKQDMTRAIMKILPETGQQEVVAQAIAVAIDGAIVRAQMDSDPSDALKSLQILLHVLLKNVQGGAG